MSTTLNLLQRLNAVQKEPGAEYIQKAQKKIGGKYTAVTHDAVARKLHPLFAKHGIIVTPSVIPETMKSVDTGTKTSGGTPIIRFEAAYAVTFRNVDEPTDTFVMNVPAHANDEGDKAPGKATSYATKGAMLKALLIESGDEEEERVEGNGDGGAGDDAPKGMADDEVATLTKQINEASSKDALKSILASAMAAAKEAGDTVRHALFKDAAIKRADKLDAVIAAAAAKEESKPEPQQEVKKAAPAIIKTLRKSIASKNASEPDVLDAVAKADKGAFETLDEISNEAAVWVMNVYLKKLETAGA
jgi:uncharacterized protein YehS (DUF1456 family)